MQTQGGHTNCSACAGEPPRQAYIQFMDAISITEVTCIERETVG